ncbi:MAG: hypothetical protein ACPMAQ_15010 [Phycisphaerae bacterium]
MVLVILLVTTASFWNSLRDPLRALQEDIALEWQGMHAVANEQIRHGCFPHWDPYALGGQRLYANILLALFYPGSVLFRVLPFPQACVATWIAHYAATALATYALARGVLKVGPAAAGVAAMVFALGGFCLGHCNHLSFVFAMPWVPLLLLAVHQFHTAPGATGGRRWWVVGTACLVFLILSGGGPVLLTALVALAWLAGVLIVRDLARQRYRNIARLGASVGAMGLAALGLAAVQILPTLDLYAASGRSDWGMGAFLGGGIPWRTLLYQLVAPGVLGDLTIGSWGQVSHETFVFVGSIALTFAVLSVLSRERRSWVAALLILLVLSAVLSLGDTVILRLLHAMIPAVKFRQPSRFVALVQLAIALLAAIGMERWRTGCAVATSRATHLVCWAVFLVMSCAMIRTLHWLDHAGESPQAFERWRAAQPAGTREWLEGASQAAIAAVTTRRSPLVTLSLAIWCGGGAAVSVCSLLGPRRLGLATGCLYAWCVLELLLFGRGTWAGQNRFPGVTDRPTPVVRFLMEHLGEDRFDNPAAYPPLAGNRGALYGLANVFGYMGSGVNVSRELAALYERIQNEPGQPPELNPFAIRYILLLEGWTTGPFQPVFRDDGVVVCANPFFVPRATFLTDVRRVSDMDTAVALLGAAGFDPRRMGLVAEGAPSAGETAPPPGPSESCRILRWEPGRIEIEAACERARWVFVSTSWDKGWQGTLDGAPIPLIRTNVCFVSARVPAGRHMLKLTYETPRLRAGIAVTLGTAGLLIAVAVLVSIHARRAGRALPV